MVGGGEEKEEEEAFLETLCFYPTVKLFVLNEAKRC